MTRLVSVRQRVAVTCLVLFVAYAAYAGESTSFFEAHCFDCHNSETRESGLNLTALGEDPADAETFALWVKVHDRLKSGEMPPPSEIRPPAQELKATIESIHKSLIAYEQSERARSITPAVRRMTRAEYENTIRDLFDMPGLQLRDRLPADGSSHGFDKHLDALSISHVNMAKYLEAADYVLDFAIASQPKAPVSRIEHVSLASQYYVRLLIAGNGGAVFLKNKQPDWDFPPTSEHQHIDQGAHERLGMYDRESSVGIFRHEDESFRPWFQGFAAIYPGQYRVRTSLWSYTWDKGQVLPARGTEAVRLSVVQLQGNGRGQDHPSYVLGYFDAPSLETESHEFVQWLNPGESIGYNVSSLAPVHIYHQYKRNVMSFTGPGIACDGMEIEGPIHDTWPPRAHRLLFGELPMVEFDPHGNDVRFPQRDRPRQSMIGAANRADDFSGNWTINSESPLADARGLLSAFLLQAFRRPVDDATINGYVALVAHRLDEGECFELAMRHAYRAALCAPEFLYHWTPATQIGEPADSYMLANRLAYFLWNSGPDSRLRELAANGTIRQPEVLRAEVERMLADGKSQRFIQDFLGQWLRLREIASTDPDKKLYPEFSTYLQDSMVMESEAYFREMIEEDLDASYLIDADFAMLNEKLASHYGIPDVSGSQIRRVALPEDSRRGGFLTQAAILKITANGTTTSPVPRGAFVMDRLLGQPPDPPPANVPAIEPDVRGAKTIREQLDKHRHDPTCASCHAKIDPPGFALESFDVIGGYRTRYRSIGDGDNPERGAIDPFIHIGFRLGPEVDCSGSLPSGANFSDVREFKKQVAADIDRLSSNLLRRLIVYSTGREASFGDRETIAEIVQRTSEQHGGVRTLIHEFVQSELFQTR
ncbi:MAG: DUF1592 domain-containing protein [Planctomycetales bacterium]|nr:DUF1592 domain-containing protein [Planctomycetales bacterium]